MVRFKIPEKKKYKFSNQNAMEQVVGLALITSDGQRPEIRNNFLHGKVTTCPYKLKHTDEAC